MKARKTQNAPRGPVRALWAEAKAAWRPIATYWLFLVVMFAAFSGAAIISEPNIGSVGGIVLLGGTTVAAVITGQIMSLLGVRDWVVWVFAAVWWGFGAMFSAALATFAGPFATLAAAVVVLFPIFLTGGLWSLRVGRALAAAWVPLVYTTGTAILVAEARGKVATWSAGQKYAIWDLFTFGVLALSIVLMLAFLLSREGHRLALWRFASRAPLSAAIAESGDARPRLSLLGWAGVGVLAFGLAIGSAVIAPYLWRTGPGDGDGQQQVEGAEGQEGQEQTEAPQDTPEGQAKKTKKQPAKRGPGPHETENPYVNAREGARADKKGQGGVILDPWTLLVLLIIGLLLGGRPAWRLWMVDRLRRPPPGTSATARIEGGWRLIQLAMADAGVELRPGEPAVALCARAAPALARFSPLDVLGLAEAAEIRDRTAYGLGVAPGDVARMAEVAPTAFDVIWDRLGDWAQTKALYRGG